MQLHKTLISALEEPSTWAGFAGVMSTMGTQITPPYNLLCYGLSALFSIIAIIVKNPDPKKE